jgi:hypothetical protein
MAESPVPGRRDWRQPKSADATRPTGKRGWQQQSQPATAKPGATPPPAPRGPILTCLTLLLLTVLIGFLVWYFYPTGGQTIYVALVGAGYEQNLALPHNVHGMRGLRDLASADETPLFQSSDVKTLTDKKESWEDAWRAIKDARGRRSLILFLALHGSAEGEPFFYLDDPAGRSRLTFTELLASLGTLSKDTPILLILEPAQASSYWPAGMLHNDFVEQLDAAWAQVKADHANVLILCASGKDQVSWVDEGWGQTAFTHFLLERLRGHRHEHISVKQLYEHVRDDVEAWSRHNRGVTQKPILLGDEEQASKFDLTKLEGLPAARPAPPTLPDADLTKRWNETVRLRKLVPAAYSPQLWRYYLDLAVRYEQLARAGSDERQLVLCRDWLNKAADELRSQARCQMASASLGWSLPMPAVLGFPLPSDLVEVNWGGEFAQLWNAKDKKSAKAELDRIEKLTSARDTVTRTLIRGQLQRALLNKLEAEFSRSHVQTAGLKSHVHDIVHLLDGPPDRAAQTHLLQMLLQDLDPTVLPSAPLLQKALRVRRMAEEAALAPLDGPMPTYTEVVFNWVRTDVDAADALRRVGEDRLFISPQEHEQAAKDLDAAENAAKETKGDQELIGFAEIIKRARHVRDALAVRDKALADLPYFAQWSASQRDPDQGQAGKQNEELERLVADLSKQIAALVERIKGPRNIDGLQAATKEVQEAHGRLQQVLRNMCSELEAPNAQHEAWHQIDSILAVPLLVNGSADTDVARNRVTLLQRSREMADRLKADAEKKLGDIRELKENRDRGDRLARAALAPYRIIDGQPLERNHQLRKVLDDLASAIQKNTADTDPPNTEKNLTRADLLCRGMLGAEPAADQRDLASRRLRVIRVNELLLWQADRTGYDHWFADRANVHLGDTYYQTAGKAYVDAAEQMVNQTMANPKLNKLKKELAGQIARSREGFAKADRLRPDAVVERFWTGLSEQPLHWTVRKDSGKYGEPFGIASAWLEDAKGADVKELRTKSEDRVQKGRIALRGLVADKSETVTAKLTRKAGTAKEDQVTGNFVALYRGFRTAAKVDVASGEPDLIIRREVPSQKPKLAVQMEPKAVCIVLDCSTSMLETYKKDKSRFEYAMDALKTALENLPDNTELSVLRFITSAKAKNLNARNLTSYAMVRNPLEWNKERDLDDLMRRLRELKDDIHPEFSRSPIAKALVEAKLPGRGFRPGTQLPKVIVALTDGDDNQTAFEEDGLRLFEKGKEAENADYIKEYLKRHFNNKDIELQIVCFLDPEQNNKQNADEYKRAVDQFSAVEHFKPRGKFHPVADENKLLAALNKAVRPRLYLPRPVGDDVEIPGTFNDEAVGWQNVPPAQYDPYLRERPLDESLRARKGDTMLLRVTRGRGRGLRRVLVSDKLTHKRVDNGWTVGMRVNLWDPIGGDGKGRKLQQEITFERDPGKDGKIIRLERPAFLWIQTRPTEGPPPRQTIWQPIYDRTAPAYKVDVYPWAAKSSAAREAVLANTDLWWTDVPPADNEVTDWIPVQLDRPGEEKIIPVGGARVRIDAITRTQLPVPTQKNSEPKDCIMVRLSSVGDKAKHFFVEMNSPLITADEHQYFSKIGNVTAVFWPSEELKTVEFRILAVDAIRERASHVRFNQLDGKLHERLLGED